MSATKKAANKSSAPKKSAAKAPAAHPSWADMIKVGNETYLFTTTLLHPPRAGMQLLDDLSDPSARGFKALETCTALWYIDEVIIAFII